MNAYPKGSKDLRTRVLGPKYYNMNGTWDLKHYYLGPWTLGVLDLLVEGAPDEAVCFLPLEGGRGRGAGQLGFRLTQTPD